MVSLALKKVQKKQRLLYEELMAHVPLRDVRRICVDYAQNKYQDFERYIFESVWAGRVDVASLHDQLLESSHDFAICFAADVRGYARNVAPFAYNLEWLFLRIASNRCHRTSCWALNDGSCACGDKLAQGY